jgi:Na+/H+ antiporter NhaD/arsenite permease-like protein
MMLSRFILAGVAVVAVAGWPRSRAAASAALAAGLASAVVAGGGVIQAAASATVPMLLFLTVALSLASLGERAGLAERAAERLARAGGGRTLPLYGLVCAVSALFTCVVSLDGAVVLMVPIVRSLSRRRGVAFGPFFLGAVAVANAASLAVPEGNPTNLVVMSRLGLSPASYLEHLLVPGLCAAVLCALVPLRWLKSGRYTARAAPPEPSSGIPLLVPWRIGAQMVGLVAALSGLLPPLQMGGSGVVTLLAVAGGTAAASAVANNLPVSASVAALATAGPGAYAAIVGLSVGALATAHGSVATLIARDLAGEEEGARWARVWIPAAAAAVIVSTLVLWAGL